MIYKLLYKIALFFISPIIVIYAFTKTIKDDKNFFYHKFGLKLDLKNENHVGIHCASLGEINGAVGIISEISKDNNVLISTSTVSGKKQAKKLFPDLDIIYFPFDYRLFIYLWLRKIKIKNFLIYETEVWPNFFEFCDKSSIKICMINARVSKKVIVGPNILKENYKFALNSCKLILCKSEYEKEKFLKLNIDKKLLLSPGNLKYSSVLNSNDELSIFRNRKKSLEKISELNDLLASEYNSQEYIKNPFFNYFLMASTHSPDELYFLKSIQYLLENNVPVVIAPRHIKRSSELEHFFKKNNCNTILYSSYLDNPIKNDGNRENFVDAEFKGVLIIDTFGDLNDFYFQAKFTYVGGGFSERGVQNIIEPSNFGNAILAGPNTDNFYEEIAYLKKENGITIIDNQDKKNIEENIVGYVKRLNEMSFNDRFEIGINAKSYTLQFSDVLEKYLTILKEEKIIIL